MSHLVFMKMGWMSAVSEHVFFSVGFKHSELDGNLRLGSVCFSPIGVIVFGT